MTLATTKAATTDRMNQNNDASYLGRSLRPCYLRVDGGGGDDAIRPRVVGAVKPGQTSSLPCQPGRSEPASRQPGPWASVPRKKVTKVWFQDGFSTDPFVENGKNVLKRKCERINRPIGRLYSVRLGEYCGTKLPPAGQGPACSGCSSSAFGPHSLFPSLVFVLLLPCLGWLGVRTRTSTPRTLRSYRGVKEAPCLRGSLPPSARVRHRVVSTCAAYLRSLPRPPARARV